MRHLCLFTLVLCASLGASLQAATVRNVPSVAYPNINSALSVAVSGDTIKVAAGRYKENVTVAGPLTNVSILGTGAIWDGNKAGTDGAQLNITCDGLTISGFEFQNGTNQLTITGLRPKVLACTFRGLYYNSSPSPLTINGGADALVSGCTFTGIQGNDINITGDRTVMKGCTIRNSDTDVYIKGDNVQFLGNSLLNMDDEGTVEITGTNARVQGNTWANLGGGSDGALYVSGSATVIENKMTNLGEAEFGIYVGGDGVVMSNKINGIGYSSDVYVIEVNGKGTVIGNTIDNINSDEGVTGIYCSSAGSYVANNKLTNLSSTYDTAYGIHLNNDGTVTGNVLNGLYEYEYNQYGIYVDGKGIVTNNVISDMTTNDDDLYGIYCSGNGSVITQNTLTILSSYESLYGIYNNDGDATVTFNILNNLNSADNYVYGIYLYLNVNSTKCTITNNSLAYLNAYEFVYGIYVAGLPATPTVNVTGNFLNNLNAGDDGTNGIYIDCAAMVSKNTVTNLFSGDSTGKGIYINGAGTATGNVIANVFNTFDDQYGIDINGKGTITGNILFNLNAQDSNLYPIYCSGANSVVSGNSLSKMSAYEEFYVIEADGNNVQVTKNTISGARNSGDDGDLYGIYTSGNFATVQQNSLSRFTLDEEDYTIYGVYINGTDAKVQFNSLQIFTGGEDVYGVYIGDVRATVSNNTFHDIYSSETSGAIIYLDGNNATVSGNVMFNLDIEYALELFGDNFTVTNNSVASLGNDSRAFYVSQSSSTSGTGGTISGNSVTDCGEAAFDLTIYFSTVSNCFANRCGSEQEYTFEISGDNNTFTGCAALNSQDDGFNISGTSNTFTSCTVLNCDRDGFDVVSGASNSFTKCVAKNCAAEGFDCSNGVTLCTVTNCIFLGNRIDYAGNSNTARTNTIFQTGGDTTAPEIDN